MILGTQWIPSETTPTGSNGLPVRRSCISYSLGPMDFACLKTNHPKRMKAAIGYYWALDQVLAVHKTHVPKTMICGRSRVI